MIKTKLTQTQIRELLQNYSLGTYKAHTPMKKGVAQTIYKLETTKSVYVLKIYDERTVKQIDAEIQLLRKIKNTLVQKPIKSNTSYRQKIANKTCVIYTYLVGAHKQKLTEKQLYELGVCLAEIHNCTQDYFPKGLEKKHKYGKKWVLELCLDLQNKFADFPQEKVQFVTKLLKKIQTPSLQKGIIHGDLHKENIVFSKNTLSGILDFDDCNYAELLLDVGSVIGYICTNETKGLDINLSNSFLKGYELKRKLSRKEKYVLFDYTLLFMLIHYCYVHYDKQNWVKKTYIEKRIEHLVNLGKDGFW